MKYIMKKLTLFLVLNLVINSLFPQNKSIYQQGVSAQENINAIINLAPYSDGAVGFDNRYEGVKGSVRLFDRLLPSYLKIKGQDFYVKLETDIDVVRNTLLFTHPKTGKLLSIPSDIVVELVVTNEGNEVIFRTTNTLAFDNDIKEPRFYQVLAESPFLFIKVPEKKFIEASYKGAYSANRPYDEYETRYKYYLSSYDNILHKIQLNKNSLLKLFPDKKEIIKEALKTGSYTNNEEMVLSVLKKF